MRRRVRFLEWQRELRMVKAVHEGERKMDFELPGQIVKPAGTARYSSRVSRMCPAYLMSPFW